MKVIDENGRLFGKINVIDLAIILSVICIIAISITAFLMKKHAALGPEAEFTEVEMDFRLIKIRPATLPFIKVGDYAFDDKGNVIGEILLVEQLKPYLQNFDMGEDMVLKKENKTLKELKAKLKLKVKIYDNQLFYDNERLQAKSPIVFKAKNYRVLADPVFGNRWVRVRVKFSGIEQETVDLIKESDVETNLQGEAVSKIVKIISKKTVDSLILKVEENKFITVTNPYQIDLIATLDILCDERANGLLFKGSILRLGDGLSFHSRDYFIKGNIIVIENDIKD